MKLAQLLYALGIQDVAELGLSEDINLEQEVRISTEKQLLPNALYDFDVAESGGVIELNPTLLRKQ